MLQSKRINGFFNECFKLNIQTVFDPKLLEYYYSLYGATESYETFEQFVLKKYGNAGGGIFDAKDKTIFAVLKSIVINPMYYMFSKLNIDGYDISPHLLLFGLIEHSHFDKFNSLILKTYGEMSLFEELKQHIKEKEKDQSFVNKPVDKKMRDVNNFINIWERENSEIFKENNKKIKSFLITFIKYHINYFKDFYKINFKGNIEEIEVVTKFYNRRFAGKYILSIDLTKANHQVLRQLGAVKNMSFHNFMSHYTDDPYLIKNKQVRQVLYGSLNGGRMGSFQRVIMTKLYKLLVENNPSLEVYIRSDDELIIILPNDIREEEKGLRPDLHLLRAARADVAVEQLIRIFDTGLGFKIYEDSVDFNIEAYQLLHIETTQGDFFIQDFGKDRFEIKSSDSKYYPQIFKIIKGLEINDNDLIFEDRNIKQLVKFVNPLKITGGTFKSKPMKKKNFLTNFFSELPCIKNVGFS